MSLTKYNQKRNFSETSEPKASRKSSGSKLIFVIQRHKASRLHYDFRLEMDGALKSWAVPKGPSLNPADKRLAMMVEDHPLDYAGFSGVIPEGNYGAGIVEIWDKGTYEYIEEVAANQQEKMLLSSLEKGSLKFILHGKKLKGEFALVKLKNAEDNAWLLIKHRDKYAVSEVYNSEDHTNKTSPINRALKKEREKKN
jgi:bifunctional non-homologous end joining protein LigD